MAEKDNSPTRLEQFTSYMNTIEDVAQVEERAADDRTDVHDKGKNDLRKIAYNVAVERGDVDPEIIRSPEDPRFADDSVKDYVKSYKANALQNASNSLIGGLESILGNINNENLEKLVGVKEVAQAADNQYAEWLGLYQKYLGAKKLKDKAESGEIDEKTRQSLRTPAAKKRAEEMRRTFAEKGNDSDRQEIAAALAFDAVMRGYCNPEAHIEGAQIQMDEFEGELRQYEEDKRINMRSYITDTLGKMVRGNKKEHETARALVYASVTGKL